METRELSCPRVTIITVVYNGEKEIEHTMLSVLNQNYAHIEYIVIDGKSNDRTVDILHKYQKIIKEKYTHITFSWLSEIDNGIYDAMNKGIALATGEWINFMNCGDTFYSNKTIESIFSNCELAEYDILYGDTLYKIKNKYYYKQATEAKELLLGMNACHQSIFTNARCLVAYNTVFKLAADYHFYHMAYQQNAKFLYTNNIVSVFSLGGITSNSPCISFIEKSLINRTIKDVKFMPRLFIMYARNRMYHLLKKIIPFPAGFSLRMKNFVQVEYPPKD